MCRDRKLFFLQLFFPSFFCWGSNAGPWACYACPYFWATLQGLQTGGLLSVCGVKLLWTEPAFGDYSNNNWRLQVTKCPHEYRKEKMMDWRVGNMLKVDCRHKTMPSWNPIQWVCINKNISKMDESAWTLAAASWFFCLFQLFLLFFPHE